MPINPKCSLLEGTLMAMMEMKGGSFIRQLDFYGRYIDDILLIASSKEQIFEFMTNLNQLQGNLRVTCEFEENTLISFSGVTFKRRPDGSLERSIHRKETWTG
jgi:hypothetical protein